MSEAAHARTAFEPLAFVELQPRAIVGLTRHAATQAEAQRELTAMLYRYLRATERMRTARTARYVAG